MQKTDMNQIVGTCHILFVCIDSLRYDVAFEEQESGGTPVLNRYSRWKKCQAPGIEIHQDVRIPGHLL